MGEKQSALQLGSTAGTRFRMRRFVSQREFLLAIFILTFGVVATFATPYFLDIDNFRQILIAISLDVIVAVGMTIVLIGGGIDLSVGSIVGLSAVVAGLAFGNDLSIPVAVFLALAAGVLVGSLNGVLISYVKINPLITTLGMMGIARSATFVLSGGYPLSVIPEAFKAFAAGDLFGTPKIGIVAIVLIVISAVLLANNVFLRKYYFLGGNEAAAFRAGINVKLIKYISYAVCGAIAAVAGLLLVSRLGSTFPHSGQGTELRVISACIIGGCSISGGRGTIIGSFLGVLLLGLINNILVLTGVSVYWQGIVGGTILILAVASDSIVNWRKYR
jgi:ribose transport system permease protein